MRMWMVDPGVLCKNHLLGEHFELHCAQNLIEGKTQTVAGHGLSFYLQHNLIEPQSIKTRHDELVTEMQRRGWTGHKTPMDFETDLISKPIDSAFSLLVLAVRCQQCRERQNNGRNSHSR